MKFRILLLTLLFSAAAFTARANSDDKTGSGPEPDVSGGVIDGDSKKPLNNVNVILVSHDTREKKSTTTDSNGSFSFSNLKGGNYKVIFQKDGFRKVVKEKIYIREDDNYQVNVEMSNADGFQLIPNIILFD